jgi:hypothetical protein
MQGEPPDTVLLCTDDALYAALLCDHLARHGVTGWVRHTPVQFEVEDPCEVWVPRSQHAAARDVVLHFESDRARGLTQPFDWSKAKIDWDAAAGDGTDA